MMGIDIEIVRAILVLALVFGSATFIVAAIKFIFWLGGMSRSQEVLTVTVQNAVTTAKAAGEGLEKVAKEIHEVLRDHEKRINGLEHEQDLQTRLDAERRRRKDPGEGV